MLDDYKNSQSLAYALISNSLLSDSVSHAYLVNTNYNSGAFNFVLAVVKAFLCPNHYTNVNMCNDCFLCSRIDSGNYPELKIIDSDGMWIKKNQILDLQEEFNKLPIEGKKRIYIIKDADKMNQQTANSILKFLEEPSSDIVAILMTDNVNKMLKTIVSRCQVINLNNNFVYKDRAIENFASISCDSLNDINIFINDEHNLELINKVVCFVEFYEKNNLDCILYSKRYLNFNGKDKNELVCFFDLIINYYYDVLNYVFTNSINFFKDYSDSVINISKINDINSIIHKIFVCISFKDKIKFNCNLNLFFDKFILELGDVYGRNS